jgi:hypothetical protein
MKTFFVVIALLTSVIANAQIFSARDFYYIDSRGKIPATSGWPITKIGLFQDKVAIYGEFGVRYIDSEDLKIVKSIGVPEWEHPNVWFIVCDKGDFRLRIMVVKDEYKRIIPIRAIFVNDNFLSIMEF